MIPSSSERLESLIAERTGWKLRLRQRESLSKDMDDRLIGLGMSHLDQYIELLQLESDASQAEWQSLVRLLTNNETYFFRDRGQIALLRDRILPELIERNEGTRTLRFWSAGCSTGEEAYSLAILIHELLPREQMVGESGWRVSILGTDIDEPSLLAAQRGIYGPWSFRSMDSALQQRYFERQAEGWKISQTCRSIVSIQKGNLTADNYPDQSKGLQDMDLILCRNVFIYFEPKAVQSVIAKFAQTLREGGYLMTGHVETDGRAMQALATRRFPESDVYQRVDPNSSPLPEAAPAQVHRPNLKLPAPPVKRIPQTPDMSVHRSQKEPAIEADKPNLVDPQTLLNTARALADVGRYDEAIECCHRLIEKQPFACEPYMVLASISQELGRLDEAKRQLKKAIYLCPELPHPYLEISALYRSEGDTERAAKMDDTALKLLQQLPADTVVGTSEGPSAQDWISHLGASSQGGV